MHQSVPFGRRARQIAGSRTPAPASPSRLEPLAPAAEAFRADLAGMQEGSSAFADWRRSRQGEQIMVWLLSALFMAPGLIGFVTQAPLGISIGLEVAAAIGNAWLRRARHRRIRDIVSWTDDAGV